MHTTTVPTTVTTDRLIEHAYAVGEEVNGKQIAEVAHRYGVDIYLYSDARGRYTNGWDTVRFIDRFYPKPKVQTTVTTITITQSTTNPSGTMYGTTNKFTQEAVAEVLRKRAVDGETWTVSVESDIAADDIVIVGKNGGI